MPRRYKQCKWCHNAFSKRDNESEAAFLKRQHCSRSCQVSTQNSERALVNRIHDIYREDDDA